MCSQSNSCSRRIRQRFLSRNACLTGWNGRANTNSHRQRHSSSPVSGVPRALRAAFAAVPLMRIPQRLVSMPTVTCCLFLALVIPPRGRTTRRPLGIARLKKSFKECFRFIVTLRWPVFWQAPLSTPLLPLRCIVILFSVTRPSKALSH